MNNGYFLTTEGSGLAKFGLFRISASTLICEIFKDLSPALCNHNYIKCIN